MDRTNQSPAMTTQRSLTAYLTYAGALPFVVAALAKLLGRQTLPVLGDINEAISIYAIVIAVFMAGVHWGQHLSRDDQWTLWLPGTSNIHAIALWLGFLWLPDRGFFVLCILSFAMLLWVDWRLKRAAIISTTYLHLRINITSIVVASLLVLVQK